MQHALAASAGCEGWYQSLVQRQLATIKEMTARRFLTPTREWPVVVVEDHDSLVVIREWPDGGLTAYSTDLSGIRRSQDDDSMRS